MLLRTWTVPRVLPFWSWKVDKVQFSSRWCLCTRKSLYMYMCPPPPPPPPALRSFPSIVFKMFSDWWCPSLTQLTFSPFQRRPSSTSSFHTSLLQAIESVTSLAVCPHVVTQTPQHFRSSKTQANCQGCFSCQAICLVISFHSDMFRAVHPQEFSEVDAEYDTCQCGLPIPLVAGLLSMWRGWYTMWSDCYLVGQSKSSGGHNVTASTSIVKLEFDTA